jgi:caa(3)-type oxidase subunit IV
VSIPVGITIALIIASTKASLVANYFMHLGEERSGWLNVTLGLTAFFWVVLMLLPLFTFSDHIGVPHTMPNANAPMEHADEAH